MMKVILRPGTSGTSGTKYINQFSIIQQGQSVNIYATNAVKRIDPQLMTMVKCAIGCKATNFLPL
jgi:hypothetical protein